MRRVHALLKKRRERENAEQLKSKHKYRLMARVLIGTSGWSYNSWRGPFFPQKLSARSHLGFYATQFATTELNGVFYRTPTVQATKTWRNSTPQDFIFAWKASRFITHWKRLSDNSRNSLALMETRLQLLGRKAGPVLFQLPSAFRGDRERLAAFLKLLNSRRHYAFEFRHSSWFESSILDLLTEHDVSLCISDHEDAPSPWYSTASFVYLRGHGPRGNYRGRYPEKTLVDWAEKIRKHKRRGRDVYVYFDNDQKSAAPNDARRLRQLIGE